MNGELTESNADNVKLNEEIDTLKDELNYLKDDTEDNSSNPKGLSELAKLYEQLFADDAARRETGSGVSLKFTASCLQSFKFLSQKLQNSVGNNLEEFLDLIAACGLQQDLCLFMYNLKKYREAYFRAFTKANNVKFEKRFVECYSAFVIELAKGVKMLKAREQAPHGSTARSKQNKPISDSLVTQIA